MTTLNMEKGAPISKLLTLSQSEIYARINKLWKFSMKGWGRSYYDDPYDHDLIQSPFKEDLEDSLIVAG